MKIKREHDDDNSHKEEEEVVKWGNGNKSSPQKETAENVYVFSEARWMRNSWNVRSGKKQNKTPD